MPLLAAYRAAGVENEQRFLSEPHRCSDAQAV